MVPLAVRRVERKPQHQKDTVPPTAPHDQWVPTQTPEDLMGSQMADPMLQQLSDWLREGCPSKEQVSLDSLAERHYWLMWPQVQERQGVL